VQIRLPNSNKHNRWYLPSTIWQTQPFKKNITIKNLVATNATLIKAIANIQLSIAQMCMAGIPTSPATTAPAPLTEAHVHISHWSNTKPALSCWVLMDARLQGQGKSLQHNMLITQDRPSAQHSPDKHHGWQHAQRWIPHPRYTLHLMGCTCGSSFHHHY
jgi:hypothetical protein